MTYNLTTKALSLLRYAIDYKSHLINQELGLDNAFITQEVLLKIVSLYEDDFEHKVRLISKVKVDINFSFDLCASVKNKSKDDIEITNFLHDRMIDWHIVASRSDFFDQAIDLKIRKLFNKSQYFKQTNQLKSALVQYLHQEDIVNGTIFDMLMHFKYLTVGLAIDVEGFDDMVLVDQINISRTLNKLAA